MAQGAHRRRGAGRRPRAAVRLRFVIGRRPVGFAAEAAGHPPAQGAHAETGLSEGKLAPDFELSQPDGSRVRLSELRGRPVLINFWATWCGSCLSEMPVIKALQEEKGTGAFTVLAVNAGETRKEALRFIDFLGAPFVYGLDTDMTVTDAYGVYGLPLSVFIDSTGVIQALYRGHAQRPLLEQFVAAAIAAQPPGPVAPVLRIISTIPRERLLTVDVHGDVLTLSSKEFRCDPSYCGRPLTALQALSVAAHALHRDGDHHAGPGRRQSGAAPVREVLRRQRRQRWPHHRRVRFGAPAPQHSGGHGLGPVRAAPGADRRPAGRGAGLRAIGYGRRPPSADAVALRGRRRIGHVYDRRGSLPHRYRRTQQSRPDDGPEPGQPPGRH